MAKENPEEKSTNKANPAKKSGIVVTIIGAVALVAGIVVLMVNLLAKPGLRDAEYLVEIGAWEREDAPSVVWNFTEIGKGTLTTNGHQNDYDFIWAIDGDKIKIETDWLYALDNEYIYTLDQSAGVLTLGDVNFRAASSVDAEVTEDN